MARHPHSTRIIPIALAASEVRLTEPLPASRGGTGWAGAQVIVTTANTTTSWTIDTTALTSGMESAALTTASRLNGLKLKTGGEVVTITGYTAAGVITVSPALGTAPAVNDLQWIQADIPLHISYLNIFNNSGNEFRYNLQDQAGLITAGQYTVIPNSMSRVLVDNSTGSPGFPIRCALDGAIAPASVEVEIYVP